MEVPDSPSALPISFLPLFRHTATFIAIECQQNKYVKSYYSVAVWRCGASGAHGWGKCRADTAVSGNI